MSSESKEGDMASHHPISLFKPPATSSSGGSNPDAGSTTDVGARYLHVGAGVPYTPGEKMGVVYGRTTEDPIAQTRVSVESVSTKITDESGSGSSISLLPIFDVLGNSVPMLVRLPKLPQAVLFSEAGAPVQNGDWAVGVNASGGLTGFTFDSSQNSWTMQAQVEPGT